MPDGKAVKRVTKDHYAIRVIYFTGRGDDILSLSKPAKRFCLKRQGLLNWEVWKEKYWEHQLDYMSGLNWYDMRVY